MLEESCQVAENINGYFDITHSFKLNNVNYHILALRREAVDKRENYFIFQCSNHKDEIRPNQSAKKSRSVNRLGSTKVSQTKETLPEIQRSKSVERRRKSESGRKVEMDATEINEIFVRTLKSERKAIVDSLRQEMNVKKEKILRSMKRQNREMIEATKNDETKAQIVRLLEEEKFLVKENYEKFVAATIRSIEELKESFLGKLNEQTKTTVESTENLQNFIVKRIEEQVSGLIETNKKLLSILEVQTTKIEKIREKFTEKSDEQSAAQIEQTKTMKKLLEEHRTSISSIVAQKHENISVDRLRETMTELFKKEKKNDEEIEIKKSSSNVEREESKSFPSADRRSDRTFSSRKTKKNKENPMKISIRSSEEIFLRAKLWIDGIDYSTRNLTLCQPDLSERNLYHCFVGAPKESSVYRVELFGKSSELSDYRSALSIEFSPSTFKHSIGLPTVYPSFHFRRCSLIEPLRQFVQTNEQITVKIFLPAAKFAEIQNGEEILRFDGQNFRNCFLNAKVSVRSDVRIFAAWNDENKVPICVFKAI